MTTETDLHKIQKALENALKPLGWHVVAMNVNRGWLGSGSADYELDIKCMGGQQISYINISHVMTPQTLPEMEPDTCCTCDIKDLMANGCKCGA